MKRLGCFPALVRFARTAGGGLDEVSNLEIFDCGGDLVYFLLLGLLG